jgi:hypothetical protein
MVQPIGDAGSQMLGDLAGQLRSKVLPDDIPAEWQWKSSFGVPPLAKVDDEVQPAFGKRELAFVNEEPEIHVAIGDSVFDLIEGRRDRLKVRLVQSECEIRAR